MAMLGGSDRPIEPGIRGDVEDELGFVGIADIAGEHCLVADEREEWWRLGWRHQPAAVARGPAVRTRDELADAEQPPELGQRQVLAERYEVRLIVARDDLAIGIDGEDRVVARVIRDRDAFGIERLARRTGQEHGTVRDHARDASERVWVLGQEEREDRFRPDDVRDVGRDAAVAFTERDQPVHDVARVGDVPVAMLEDHRLHEPDAHVVALIDAGAAEPPIAVADLCGDEANGEEERQQTQHDAATIGRPDERRRHGDQHRNEGEAVNADDGRELQHLIVGGERIAEEIEGEARKHVPAQPFGRGKERREGHDAQRPARPHEVRERRGDGPKQRQERGKPADAERHQREIETALLDEGGAEPIERDDEIA
jgi:hypothetical protein